LASETHVAGLMTGKAGVIHFHLGDGDRKLELVERAINETELPARTFNPTHVNRNKPLFDHACSLLKLGIYADITAFPEGCAEPGWSAAQAIELAIKRKLPLGQLTVSSDGGGCMPFFNEQGELTKMDFGRASTIHDTIKDCLTMGIDLETILPLMTSNVADLLRLGHKGRVEVGKDADLIILDEENDVSSVMVNGHWHKKRGKQLVKGTFE
jgi:beta-aspartyl-dipeptidase (metallo-type)